LYVRMPNPAPRSAEKYVSPASVKPKLRADTHHEIRGPLTRHSDAISATHAALRRNQGHSFSEHRNLGTQSGLGRGQHVRRCMRAGRERVAVASGGIGQKWIVPSTAWARGAGSDSASTRMPPFTHNSSSSHSEAGSQGAVGGMWRMDGWQYGGAGTDAAHSCNEHATATETVPSVRTAA